MASSTTTTTTIKKAPYSHHEPCPACQAGGSDGRGDNLARYTDGGAHCHKCGYHEFSDAGTGGGRKGNIPSSPLSFSPLDSEPIPLKARGITQATCSRFSYGVGVYRGERCHVAPYYAEGELKAQHIRMEGKKFRWIGDVSDIELFGQHLWAAGGKRLTITEGELDALAVSQMQENKWPVVSIPSGAESAEKYIKLNLEWVESFETVVFAFDMDEPGKRAAGKCAALLSPGKARIANLPAKDGNECLLKGLTRDCITALWQASPYRPDGILAGADLWESIVSPVSAGYSIQFPELNHMLRGVRGGELCLFTAGSGIGKSTLVNEIAYHLHHEHGLPIGVLALEESPGRNALRYLGIHLNKPLHLPEARGAVSDDELRGAFDAVLTNGWYVYNHFGSSDTDTLLSKIRYMVVGLGCKVIVLDHISIVISGLEQTGVAGDERRTIDILMTRLRKLVEETGMILLAVVHLKRPPDGGKAYNEGRKVSLSDLRGSGSLEQLSDAVVALERDQQGEKPNLASIRVLKNRTVGVCGFAGEVEYTPETGRLLPVVAGEMGKADECPFSPEEEGAEMEERGKALIGDF